MRLGLFLNPDDADDMKCQLVFNKLHVYDIIS
jgi:hypothetical protein